MRNIIKTRRQPGFTILFYIYILHFYCHVFIFSTNDIQETTKPSTPPSNLLQLSNHNLKGDRALFYQKLRHFIAFKLCNQFLTTDNRLSFIAIQRRNIRPCCFQIPKGSGNQGLSRIKGTDNNINLHQNTTSFPLCNNHARTHSRSEH